MIRESVLVKNASGLHARPAAMFVNEARRYESELTVWKGEKSCNGKSMLSLLALGVGAGCEIALACEGSDESEALEAMVKLVNSGFGE